MGVQRLALLARLWRSVIQAFSCEVFVCGRAADCLWACSVSLPRVEWLARYLRSVIQALSREVCLWACGVSLPRNEFRGGTLFADCFLLFAICCLRGLLIGGGFGRGL